MERCACGHDARSHMGGRCWVSRGCARDADPHAVCSPECKAERVCPCEGFRPTSTDAAERPAGRPVTRPTP